MIRKRLTWAEIDLKKYEHNFRSLRSLLKPQTKLMAVVKGNAYGHGIVPIAEKAVTLGADYFGVVCLFEAEQLRSAGITTPILLMNYTDPESVDRAVELGLTINVMDSEVLNAVDIAAKKRNKKAKIHVKIDTGMHRLGLLPEEALSFISSIPDYKYIELEGIFTHLASADDSDLSFAREQLDVFSNVISELKKKGIRPPLIHAANGVATLRLPESHFTLVRPGKILYGPLPKESYTLPFVSESVLTLKTQIAQIRKIHKGESVGYARGFIADGDMTIAAIPVGYADGFRRSPNFGEVLIKGNRAALVGRVSMDQSSIDVTNVSNVAIGDEVVLIGKQGEIEITTQEIADRLGTINYEVLTSLSERVTRIYYY